jgi:sulfoxide reductase heme-binding subunit YedZ
MGLLFYGALANTLGPDPAETIMHITGEWSARMLLLTLLISPLRQWTGWRLLTKLRRMLGLYAFSYALIHLATFGHFYLGWSAQLLAEELAERPYITMGFGALLMLLPLAVTSTKAMQRRLGRNWQRLHRLIYVAAVLVCVHILWQLRSDAGEAIVYITLFVALLGWRLARFNSKRRRQTVISGLSGTR